MVINATACHIINDKKQLLLIKKPPQLFGGGKWNAVGGKIQEGENPEQTCMREVFEESGLRVSHLKYHGFLEFWFGKKPEPDWVVHAFSTSFFRGELKESDEGVLRWTRLDHIPYEEMWEDNRHWFPPLLEGKKFHGRFWYNKEGTTLLEHLMNVKEG